MTADWGDIQPNDSFGYDWNELSYEAIDTYDNAMMIIALDYPEKIVSDSHKKAKWAQMSDEFSTNTRKHLWDVDNMKFILHIYPSSCYYQFYDIEPTHGYGYGQDEDQEQLGAWFVMAAMGIFDVQGSTSLDATMQIGSPLFDKITIHLNPNYYSGKEFVIEAENNSSKSYYVQSATLQGEDLNNCFIPLKSIQKRGVLKLEMGETPNENWGVDNLPPSMSDSFFLIK